MEGAVMPLLSSILAAISIYSHKEEIGMMKKNNSYTFMYGDNHNDGIRLCKQKAGNRSAGDR